MINTISITLDNSHHLFVEGSKVLDSIQYYKCDLKEVIFWILI